MYSKWIFKYLEYAVIVVPLTIGAFQIYFSKADTLSSWRGGGFGMYTEPHPVKSRVAFLINYSDGTGSWIRAYPLEERLKGDTSINKTYLNQLRGISGTIANRISFPSRIDEEKLERGLEKIRNETSLQNSVFYPADTITLQVLEIDISSENESIVQTVIYEGLLCLKK